MTSNVEPLPLPTGLADHIDVWVGNPFARPKLHAMIQNHARANVEHHNSAKDAEIQALRAEVEMLREDARRNTGCMWRVQKGYTSHCQPPKNMRDALARAERLAEALREICKNAPESEPGDDARDSGNRDDMASEAADREHFRLAEVARAALHPTAAHEDKIND